MADSEREKPMDDAKSRAVEAVDHLHRIACDVEGRFDRSRAAGRALAVAVQQFVADPEGMGTNWLAQWAQEFLIQDSGNFGPMTNQEGSALFGVSSAGVFQAAYQATQRP